MPFLKQLQKRIIYLLSCCNEPERPLQIGPPTDFRREDIKIEGLTEAQQTFIREKAIADAIRLFDGRPVSSLPSPTFPSPASTDDLPDHAHHRSIKQRIGSFLPCGYHPVYTDTELSGSTVMLRDQQNGKGGFEEQGVKGGFSQSRDSVTLGGSGSEVFGSEKDVAGKV